MSKTTSLTQAKYYDKPDGEDLAGKLVYTNKWAAAVGIGSATADVLMYSHTKGYLATLARYAFFVAPACGIASSFTFGTYISTRLRGKDDVYNYFVGSVAAGGVVGRWAKSVKAGLFFSGVFCIASIAKRTSINEGWEFFPAIPQGWGNIRSIRQDCSIVDEREPGWTTGK